MNYTKHNDNNQSKNTNYLKLPSNLDGFVNTDTTIELNSSRKEIICFKRYIPLSMDDLICPICWSSTILANNSYVVNIKHLPYGSTYTQLCINRIQLICNHCGSTKMQEIPFKDDNHLITKYLKTYTEDLLSCN